MQLRFELDGSEQRVTLEAEPVRVGRGDENDLVLPDYSVSRQHALFSLDGSAWYVEDLNSTNGVQVNRLPVKKSKLAAGDRVKIGIFELTVEDIEDIEEIDEAEVNATIIRKLSDFSSELGQGLELPPSLSQPAAPVAKEDSAPEIAESVTGRFFRFLNRLAREMIHANTTDEVLTRVMDIAFEALAVDRGFILVGSRSNARCELMRIGDEITLRPEGDAPVSRTILRKVMDEEVGLLTIDAQEDDRLVGGKSIMLHGIRSAMCAPLWSSNKITGFMQVDSHYNKGSFSQQDLDFLITLANYAAVGVQRIQERKARGRLERYHSPAVLDAVMQEAGDSSGDGQSRLRNAEVTVLFADLVGFTSFSESASLDDIAELLTGYCARSVSAIFDEGGTLDKYIGDCVMAFFGAPIRQADHAVRGVRAGLRIQTAVDEWNLERKAQGLPDVRCRVAINSGPVVVGDVGSEQRVDYTVLGNTVNVAARLESACAAPGEVVIGEKTDECLKRQAGGEGIRRELLDHFSLKGLQQKVAVYKVVRPGGKPATAASVAKPASASP